ncbi:hybrid signal transduction protein dokA-like [Sabethes cyaneus]|uniref:hybrid signal transduction protein dokA-like n=1 Tax=Sabethes cyaneus TaxID=53552 RepID=UPI00237DC81E|nr:hybrid signal transduction protein dokA-like [Sabethes cyaneus]
MRPNATPHDRYRWKKMDQQQQPAAADRKSTTTVVDGGGTDQKIPLPVTTTSPPTAAAAMAGSTTGTTPAVNATAGGAGAAPGGTPGSSPSRRGTKRKSSGSAAARKRRKLQQAQLKAGEPAAEQVPQTKNTVAVLNELKRNLVYNLESQTGPVHAPLFSMSVVVDGQKFIGHGRSKKLARIEAAAAALRSFIQFKDGATLTPIKPLHNVDFTSDDPMIENSIFPLSDPPVLPEAVPASPGKTEKANSKGSASEKGHISRRAESKERQNGPNHNNNNNYNTNNNNNNVHSTNNILATTTNTTTSVTAAAANQAQISSSALSNSNSIVNNYNSNGKNNAYSSNNSNLTTMATAATIPAAVTGPPQNGHRQVVEKIQQSLDLFKNSNEKNVAWKKRLETITHPPTPSPLFFVIRIRVIRILLQL